jgi:alpha,alpha-trehalose-phosphate synthase [UDP-forming]
MKITVRLIVSLLFAAASVAAIFSYFQVRNERELMARELDARANVLAEGFEETIMTCVDAHDRTRLEQLLDRLGSRTKLLGIAVYDSAGIGLAASRSLKTRFSSTPELVQEAFVRGTSVSSTDTVNNKVAHLFVRPVGLSGSAGGAILLYHDASFIDDRLRGIWYSNFTRLLAQIALIIITTVVVVRWSITGPIAQAARWLQSLRTEKGPPPGTPPDGGILGPLGVEVSLIAKSLAQARASAQREARLRMSGEALWTAERLKQHVQTELHTKNLFVISNREPFLHSNSGGTVECIVPAGGLVTALDPILRACGGVWIAHGSGNADRDFSDADGRLSVPPEDPAYTLHRVFLSKEEEEGYYYGFANEGIWPLCHITHTRPLFRKEDWEYYKIVNRKFASALLEDIRNEVEPLVLIQDYHFALLPMMIKADRPDARVAIFWHIPWPNPEVFGICPWKEEILNGLLGADVIGFHTQFHCNNFLETVDRVLESRTNWEHFSVERNRQLSMIRPFPISVAYPYGSEEEHPLQVGTPTVANLKSYGISARYVALGVDRIDYTKGIIERFLAVERFLELYPGYVGKFTFVQLGAPSRTHIKRYHDLGAELDETVERINWKFQRKGWKAILFLKAHHSHTTINTFYRLADVCLVTSLHDGMNLVAKEYVASRVDEDGVLVLSQFAGAANELRDALIVNPYHIEEVAEAIARGITMEKNERQKRMKEMRATVRERNVFRWAANIISALSRVRLASDPGAGETLKS